MIATNIQCIYYRFIQPELFCDFRFNHIMKEVSPPLIYTPLKIIPELQYFLNGSITYLKGDKVCRDLLSLKRKELAFVLGYYYSDYDLSSLVHPLSKYVNSFQYFVIHQKKDKIFFTLLSRFMKTTLINHMSNGITHRFWTYLTIPGSLTNRWHTLTVFVFVYAASKNIWNLSYCHKKREKSEKEVMLYRYIKIELYNSLILYSSIYQSKP